MIDREKMYKEFDKLFNAGWKSFVEDIHDQNDKSNNRLFKTLIPIKGERFIDDLKSLMNSIDHPHGLLMVTRKPAGILLGDNRWKTIPKLWIDQKSTEDGMSGSLFVEIKPDRWIKIRF